MPGRRWPSSATWRPRALICASTPNSWCTTGATSCWCEPEARGRWATRPRNTWPRRRPASSPAAQPADEAPPEEAAEPILESAPATDTVTPAGVDDGHAREEIWAQVQQLLSKKGSPRLKALLRDSCTPMGIEGDTFVVQA